MLSQTVHRTCIELVSYCWWEHSHRSCCESSWI